MRWERDAAAMRTALDRHDEVMAGAIGAYGGVWFKRVGDAVQAAFRTAPAALAAAVEAQRGLAATAWGPDGALVVRMALHIGEAAPRGGDYVAPCLNRLARLMAAGHGGQILLSEAVALLVRDDLPRDVTLQAMGAHRLRDLLEPEVVHQVLVDGLPQRFPPLRTLDSHPNNLPQAVTPLVDRAQELAAVRHLLRGHDVRMVTLTGPGGIGKSRLALQLAADMLDDFADGVYLVRLATVREPVLVLPAIAAVLAVPEGGGEPLAAALEARLANRSTLVILDNVEQVLEVGPELATLLEACSGLTFLVTSRAPLRVRGEHDVAVGPLDLPDAEAADRDLSPSAGGADAIDRAGALAASPAVMLFVSRAQAASSDFRLTPENAAAVAEICRRLDGVPLAIELAAARARLLPPAALLARLEGRLPQLGGGLRDLPKRQQTLAATLDWSHALLDEDQQRLFRRLAVFRGGWTIALAESVCGADAAAPERDRAAFLDVFNALSALSDMSLIQGAFADGDARFTMFHVVAEYAAQRLADAGEAEWIGRRHAAAMAALAAAGQPELSSGDPSAVLDRLSAEHGNLVAALDGLLACGDGQAALSLAADLWRFWYLRGYLVEGRTKLSQALAGLGADAAGRPRARALNGLGVLCWLQGDYSAARAALEEARTLTSALGDDALMLRVTHNLGIAAVDEGDLETAMTLAEGNLLVARRLGDLHAESSVLHSLGVLAAEQARVEDARAHFMAALTIQRKLSDREGAAASMINLAGLCLVAGDLDGAERWLDEGQQLAIAVEDVWSIATSHITRAEVAIDRGRLDEARRELATVATLRLKSGDRKGLSRVLPLSARLALAKGDAAVAAEALGAAAALRARLGAPLTPRERPRLDADIRAARAALGDDAFEAAWALGTALSAEDAIALGLGAEA